MKKIVYIGFIMGLVLSACSRDEDDLFSSSVAERRQAAKDATTQQLCSASNGWEMLYFPNPESAGYSVLLKFSANGQVTAASRNPQTTNNAYQIVDNSMWTIKADGGLFLSFDTNNKIMHAWADPRPTGNGYLGDYEFLIMSTSSDCIRLKGKKHEAYITMYPLSTGVDWSEYFNQVYVQRDLIVKNNNGTEFIYSANGTQERLTYRDGLMIKDLSDGTYFPFVVRPSGITFERGITFGGVTAYNFSINQEKSRLVCTDGISAEFQPAMTFVENLNAKLDNGVKWKLDTKDMGETSLNAYNAIVNALNKQSCKYSNIQILRVPKQVISDGDTTKVMQDQMLVEYKKGGTVKVGMYELKYAFTNDILTYTYIAPIDDESQTATALLNILGGGKGQDQKGAAMLSALICGDFTITSATGSLINAQQLYWTSTTDANKRIKFIAQ